MHARTDQLLSVLDREPVDATVHAHLEQCASCAAQLTALTRTTEQLRALPQLEPPKLAWEQIAARLPGVPTARPQRRWYSAVAAVAVGAVALTIGVNQWRQPESARPTVQLASTQPMASRQQLIRRSQEQDELLEYFPQRPSVQRAALSVTVDAIEQRVQWLDWRLSEPPEAKLNDEQARVLWNERVTLMDSLIKLRYAEGERLAF